MEVAGWNLLWWLLTAPELELGYELPTQVGTTPIVYERFLGLGATSSVYEVTHQQLRVVLKMARPGFAPAIRDEHETLTMINARHVGDSV